uniref:Uncharacterized protein n=1 Tax=Pyricularia oryzae (strain P131) TaxID=1143193 RepID=L7J3T8_PYRO1
MLDQPQLLRFHPDYVVRKATGFYRSLPTAVEA